MTCIVFYMEHTVYNRGPTTFQIPRSILRQDTGISTVSDGTGPLEIEPLTSAVNALMDPSGEPRLQL